jgi:UDP-glucose 4-epimerase
VTRVRVLVTGAGGFLGRWVVRGLAEAGHAPVAVVRAGGAPPRSAERIEADLREPGALLRACPHPPETVVHLAAQLPPAFTGPAADAAGEATRRMDAEVFGACAAWGAPAVYASGTSLYAPGDGTPRDESAPVAPLGPYLEAKRAGERAGAEALDRAGAPFCVLRISAPYGPGQAAATVLRRFVELALAGEPLRFHGSGSREQDFTWAADAAACVEAAVALRAGGVYNVASGAPVTMRELARRVVAAVPGSASEVCPSGQPDPQEGATARFDVRRAARELGWAPRVGLDAGIAALVGERRAA